MAEPISMATVYIISTLANAISGTVNGAMGRKQQEKLADENRKLTLEMENNRQQFQLDMHMKNAEMQRELNWTNHELRLKEQTVNFENLCKTAEWNKFLDRWPLITLPSVVRTQQVLENSTVCLRVIFSRSSNNLFNTYIYPKVEQGLKEFTDIYHNAFNSRNIIFYHNAFASNINGGAVNENIYYALKGLPVLIIDTNVIGDEVCVSLTIWGFGSFEKSQITVFKIRFEQKTIDSKPDQQYYSQFAENVLSYLKFIIGYAYDAYNLIQYDTAPLLPRVAEYDHQMHLNSGSCDILSIPELKMQFAQKYSQMYDMVLGSFFDEECKFNMHYYKNYKVLCLHQLRLEFAKSIRTAISEVQYANYLYESLAAWTQIRTTQLPNEFLQYIKNNRELIEQYFSDDDSKYFFDLAEAFKGISSIGKYDSTQILVLEIIQLLDQLPLQLNSTCKVKIQSSLIPTCAESIRGKYDI